MGPLFTGPIHEIAADISTSRLRLSALARYHPLRPFSACLLALRLLERYELSDQKDDIDKAILHLTESLLLSPLSWLEHGPKIFEVLSCLAKSLSERSIASKEPEHAIYASKYLRYLRDPAHTPFPFRRQLVTALLLKTLKYQIELKASDEVQSLEEMTALMQELLTSDPSSDYTTRASSCFARAVAYTLPQLFSERLLNEIIECLRLARIHKSELREVHFSLAKCLHTRYKYTMGDEIEEAASIVDEMIASSPPGDEFLAVCQELVPRLAMFRSVSRSHAENSKEAIYRARAFLSSSSAGDPLYPTWSHALELAAKNHFENFGPIDSLEASSSSDLALNPWVVKGDETEETWPLDGLLDGICNNNITDIGETIELCRSILASSDPSDLQSSDVFCEILFEAFERTKNINYLNESIHTSRQLLARRPPNFMRFGIVSGLSAYLHTCSEISLDHRMQDQHEIAELLPQFLDDGSQFLSLPN